MDGNPGCAARWTRDDPGLRCGTALRFVSLAEPAAHGAVSGRVVFGSPVLLSDVADRVHDDRVGANRVEDSVGGAPAAAVIELAQFDGNVRILTCEWESFGVFAQHCKLALKTLIPTFRRG